ncbi:MAG TPA: MBL fold metallo-hydrolase, partial [Gammaproteobacteria bacterium]|nr:MBL fold metallo-hydrolase [Gammaproteobacteria bacterium]
QAAAAPTLTDLGSDLVLVEGAGANVVALASADGLLLVDGGSEDRAAALQGALAARWPGRPVTIVFNTNWRAEHTGGNAALRGAGATAMAHENTKLWLGGDFFVDWEDRHYAPHPAAMLPNKTFYTSGKVELGGRNVEYWHLPRAHTDGDVAVFFPDENVLVASDLLSVGRYPVPDYATGGWIGGFIDATQKLLDATDARTRIVAAQGTVYGRAELEAQLALCKAVAQKTAEAFRVGMSFADFVASKPTAAFDAKWGDPRLFLRLVYKGGFAHLRELGGVI